MNTKTGTLIFVAEWREGQYPKARIGVARLLVTDDNKCAVWRYTGKRRDAAEKLGELYAAARDCVAFLNGDYIHVETPETDMWRGVGLPDENGDFDEFEFDSDKYPDVVWY